MQLIFRLCRSRKLLFVLILLAIDVVYVNVYLTFFEEDIRTCYTHQPAKINQNHANYELLDDILQSPRKPRLDRSIIFHETRCHQEPKSLIDDYLPKKQHSKSKVKVNVMSLSARQACAVESAALLNPNFDVFVLFTTPAYTNKATEKSFIAALTSYSNIFLRNLDLWSYAKVAPAEGFLESGVLFKSRFLTVHVADFLRLLTLWRYGGIYLDLDVISLKSIERLPLNYVGAESKEYLNNAILGFASTGWGHKLIEECLTEFKHTYDKDSWGHNGPILLTRVIQKMCNIDSIDELTKTDCNGLRSFGEHAFHEIPWGEWQQLFEPQYTELVLNRLNDSYMLHTWNKDSSSRGLRKDYDTAYGRIARKNCPKVWALAKNYL